jgi:2-phosphoglycerate kinase
MNILQRDRQSNGSAGSGSHTPGMGSTTPSERSWDVLLLGGASGVGKSTVGYRLAHQLGMGIAEVDDLHRAVRAMTTPEQQPILHYWHTRPDAMSMPAQQIVELHISVCRLLLPALRAVITQHVEDGRPIVLEGDYLVPEVLDPHEEWAPGHLERVRAVFLDEPDTSQIVRNLYQREQDKGDQSGRARVTQMFAAWLRAECQHRSVPSLPVRPFDTAPDRVLEALIVERA